MSFVYAEKTNIVFDDETFNTLHIFSDTKLTIYGAVRANWGETTRRRIERYGIVKSMIIGPKCCISFAGNDITHANRLLEEIYSAGSLSDEDLLKCAYDIHMSAPQDDIEFLICTANENDEVTITCIKDRQVNENCICAWIGSHAAYNMLRWKQEELSTGAYQHTSIEMMEQTIEECGDTTVGKYVVDVRYDRNQHSFVYSERLTSSYERNQIVRLGEKIKLGGTAEEGAYTAHFLESNTDVVIEIAQNDLTILFTNRYRLEEPHNVNDHTKHFMLPLLIKTSTGTVLP